MTFDTWKMIPVIYRKAFVKSLFQSKKIYVAGLEQLKIRTYFEGVNFDTVDTESKDYFNPKYALTDRKMCNDSIQICGKGQSLKHGHFKSENWTRSYGWFCQRCHHGFYKNTIGNNKCKICLLYTSPSPRDKRQSRMPSSA